MATTENLYTGNGSTVLYSFTFPYLKTTDVKVTLDGTATTAYTLANATQVQFTTAPASGVAIRIYRETASDELSASFFSGASIRADDLNNNFLQNIYVTQETEFDVNQAVTTANTANSTANNALSTANTASTAASNAVTTANTANTNATAAQSAASAAASDASAAASSASSAQTSATAAASSASSAASSASQAISDAAAAQADADANTTRSVASKIVTDAFTATGDPATALLVDVPIDAANGVKLPTSSNSYDEEGAIRYNTTLDKIEIRKGSGWSTAAGGAAISSTPPSLATSGDVWYDHDNGRAYVYYNDGDSNQWVEMNPSWNGYVSDASISTAKIVDGAVTTAKIADDSVTSAKIVDGTIVNADINASAAIAGTKVSPDFGSQNVVTTGNVGIGATSANANLDIAESSTSSSLPSTVTATSPNGASIDLVNTSGTTDSGGSINGVGLGTSGRFASMYFLDSTSDNTGTGGHIAFATSASKTGALEERMRIDSSGNVGIGASDPVEPLCIRSSTGGNIYLQANNTSSNSGSSIFFKTTTSFATSAGSHAVISGVRTDSSNGYLTFMTRGSGTTTERMRINNSGYVGIGTTSPSAALHVSKDIEPQLILERATTTTGASFLRFTNGGGNYYIGPDSSAGDRATSSGGAVYGFTFTTESARPLVFATNNYERLRIDENGYVTVSKNLVTGYNAGVGYNGGDGNYIQSQASTTGNSYAIMRGRYVSNSNYTWQATISGTVKSQIQADGSFHSAVNSYGSTSDARLKENIVDAGSQWEDIKAITVRKFNYTEESGQDTHTQIGVVAQEVELVSPGLVTETPDLDVDDNDLGTTTKSVKYSVLYMKAVKALQEAMERIETLETQNTDLAARITALETN